MDTMNRSYLFKNCTFNFYNVPPPENNYALKTINTESVVHKEPNNRTIHIKLNYGSRITISRSSYEYRRKITIRYGNK